VQKKKHATDRIALNNFHTH